MEVEPEHGGLLLTREENGNLTRIARNDLPCGFLLAGFAFGGFCLLCYDGFEFEGSRDAAGSVLSVFVCHIDLTRIAQPVRNGFTRRSGLEGMNLNLATTYARRSLGCLMLVCINTFERPKVVAVRQEIFDFADV